MAGKSDWWAVLTATLLLKSQRTGRAAGAGSREAMRCPQASVRWPSDGLSLYYFLPSEANPNQARGMRSGARPGLASPPELPAAGPLSGHLPL